MLIVPTMDTAKISPSRRQRCTLQVAEVVQLKAPDASAMFGKSHRRSESMSSASTIDRCSDSSSCSEESDYGEIEEANPYPHGVVVKNTFIDFESSASEFLGEFFRRRETRSAPSSTADSWHEEEEDANSVNSAEDSNEASSPTTAAGLAVEVSQFQWKEAQTAAPRVVLSLIDALCEEVAPVVPEFSFPELPSIGSAEHHLGTCKPCAFVYKNCTEGVHCTFCHLCAPDERRTRRKAKIEHLRLLRQQQRI